MSVRLRTSTVGTVKCRKCGGRKKPRAKCNLCEMFAAAGTPGGHLPGNWPLVSESAACHPKQVAEANDLYAKHGCSSRHLPDGRLVFTDRGDRKKVLKVRGEHDRIGGYGD